MLARLEPISFLDTLVELAEGSNFIARQQAVFLLGHAGHPRAAQAITAVAARLHESDDQQIAIEAMVRLDSPELVGWSLRLLQSPENELRRVVLVYLDRFGDAGAVPAVLEALKQEKNPALLPRYVDFLARVAERDASVADALIPLTGDIRLDLVDQRALCAALAHVAPPGHKPTLNIMRGFLERGETSALGVTAARTMLALGDERGQKMLFDALDDRVRKRRQELHRHVERRVSIPVRVPHSTRVFHEHRGPFRDPIHRASVLNTLKAEANLVAGLDSKLGQGSLSEPELPP